MLLKYVGYEPRVGSCARYANLAKIGNAAVQCALDCVFNLASMLCDYFVAGHYL
jgi:hypothetical protein